MSKSTALRLADEVAAMQPAYFTREVATELRRLVADNERLHQINQSHEMKLSVRGYEIQIEDLRLAHAELRDRNAELLEALRKLLFADDQERDDAVVGARAIETKLKEKNHD